MSTDGGAWALIGRKTDAVTWTVPSNNKTVEPFGKPHWSSSLGDAPIVDFRVQVATKEDFSATRAHWSFRLKNKRPLKNLLMLNEGGCGRLWPGIGDISYVKDLQTEEIVTTKFRCSQFSSHHSKSDGYGWDMLNSCLNHPCSPGFAFHKKYPVQMDFSATGASGNTSGIIHDSTSFVGCENHKCCGCFGPVGGKKNYCGTECRAKNGGTIVKNLYTWFWVRSSLPKRVWNKCMEYKVTVAQGKVVWYKLYHGNTVPVMGRCIQNDALLNDGIVVVPDSAAAQKVPPVPGLLEYREDTKRLYVRSNGTWNVIGEQKKVLGKAVEQIKPRFEQLEKKVTNEHKTDFEQLKKSLAELKSQLGSVNKSLNVMKPKVLGESCATLYKSGKRYDGVYTVNYPHDLGSFQVRCDMQTDGGGWTVFQRRQDASVNFYRGWQDYKSGFGDLNGNFWLGLDEIHRLTKSGQNVLRVDLMDWTNETAYAKYGSFSVASESNGYRLDLGSFSETTDGSNPTGEYFNPAYDCSDALNKISGAMAGFYWIKLSGNVPKKAYCDMSTDGGGWVLIGRKTNAVTWTVPSNNKTVEPFGKPHWSSSLGDAPIVDFRVQMATQEDFSATKAHWSFRLKNKRALKNLLMLNKGGCGRLWPGIGDISYVKDLQTEEIVTTKFRCSQFSSYHSKSDGYGWDMLNNCLNSPCSPGFAFHTKYPVQMDFSGAFSYSASGNITSGITHESTSFVGCENHKCCGCFGPVGGKKNYCGTDCSVKNGGTFVKNVYTWFWVRSSLPKRVWNKCMEYKVTVSQGKVVWYKLYNGNSIPVMGRCDRNEILLDDGIVVVPDRATAQKVPPVPGLLEYRKDTQKLYVRSNQTWNVIGQENKLNIEFAKLEKNLAELKTQLGRVNKTVNADHIKDK
ncbi:Hypothetical predicted protein, partial [Paramuricea clavata]